MDLTLSEKMMYNVLYITMLNTQKKTIGTATGFIFAFCDDGTKHVTCIVTNRHVLSNCAVIRVAFTREKDDNTPDIGSLIQVEVETNSAIFHPDPKIDLAVLPISQMVNLLNATGQKIFFTTFTIADIPNAERWKNYCTIENVIMAGYPKGFRDEVNNQPIFRSGITATHPALNFRGRPEFLIDMPCFEGCSGSPVLICDEGIHVDKRKKSVIIGNRLELLGIQYAIPRQQSIGQLAEIKTDSNPSVPIVPLYINLGFIIKSTELLVFENIIRTKLNP